MDVERDNSIPGAVLAAFSPLGGGWRYYPLGSRLNGG
jgi:hypothetical protein